MLLFLFCKVKITFLNEFVKCFTGIRLHSPGAGYRKKLEKLKQHVLRVPLQYSGLMKILFYRYCYNKPAFLQCGVILHFKTGQISIHHSFPFFLPGCQSIVIKPFCRLIQLTLIGCNLLWVVRYRLSPAYPGFSKLPSVFLPSRHHDGKNTDSRLWQPVHPTYCPRRS